MTKSERDFEHAFVAIEFDHVARAIDHSGTVFASANMFVDRDAQSGVDFAVEIVRDFKPDLFAVHDHGFVPFSKDKLLFMLHAPPRPGASKSRSIRRARNRRVLTDAVEISSALAVSSMLRCCMSRSTKTSR